MFYIMNAQGKCIGSCNTEPCADDLASRGEYVLDYAGECKPGWTLDEADIPQAPVPPPLTLAQMTDRERYSRDSRLADFDRELYRNQFFWSALTAEQQAERLAYRQTLLDVPQQAGFPIDIIWPAYPTL